jgi:tetratricopeptide (TPR) repeat protein
MSPELPLANMMLGSIHGLRREWDEAEDRFKRVLALEPNAYEPQEWLAGIARETGRLEEALSASQELIRAHPNAPGAYMSFALCRLKQGRANEAVPFLETAVRLAPSHPVFRYNLASALKDAGRSEEALREYQEVLRLDPFSGKADLAIGSLLIEMGRPEEALVHLRSFVGKQPGSFGFAQLAHGLAEAQRYDEAGASIRKSLELDPSVSGSHAALGIHLMHLGRFEEAISSFERAIQLDKANVGAYFGLTRCKKFGEEDLDLISKMEELSADPIRKADELRELHYALGKAHDDLHEYEAAFPHFVQANRHSKEIQLGKRPFDRAGTEAHNDLLISTFCDEFYRSHADLGVDTDLPVFIVGMVRSGTTLCEQMLSCHPQIGAGGELTFWIEDRARGETLNVLHRRVDRVALKTLRDDYLRLLRERVPSGSRITDKMPLNYLSLGLIRLLFPNARIIHCRRDPLDTCLSVFATPYRNAPDFFYDLENIATGYREYLRLMEHWRSVIPSDRLLEVRYEDLATDLERSAPPVVEFCGVEWNEACLHPERNVRSVLTPSAWQVRQGAYQSSIGRWRSYEPWLGPLRDLAENKRV